MCQHGPEATQGLGLDARPQQGDIAFQVGSDEILSPPLADTITGGQIAVRKATTYPQSVQV